MPKALLISLCLICAACSPKTLEPQEQPDLFTLGPIEEVTNGQSSLYAHCESPDDHGGTCKPVSELIEDEPTDKER